MTLSLPTRVRGYASSTPPPARVHKLVITGVGRSGTTFLVQLLTELGLDTGYTPETWRNDYDERCSAGLERNIRDPDAPYVVKNPALCSELESLLAERWLALDHVLVPLRDLETATRSRLRLGGSDGSVPGGIWGTSQPNRQKAVLAEQFYLLMQTLVKHQVPFTFLEFPRIVHDAGYAWERLRPVLPRVTREQFDAAFRAVARPKLVHSFSSHQPPTPPSAERPLPRERWKRWRRQAKRLAVAVGLLAAGFAIGQRARSADFAVDSRTPPPSFDIAPGIRADRAGATSPAQAP